MIPLHVRVCPIEDKVVCARLDEPDEAIISVLHLVIAPPKVICVPFHRPQRFYYPRAHGRNVPRYLYPRPKNLALVKSDRLEFSL